ncbi:MAG: hypothetical protein PHQ80_01210 [Candidatus ainarchaeum sp.]|nr:hypothetical protein [Candidatus ainarchaeum sp.]
MPRGAHATRGERREGQSELEMTRQQGFTVYGPVNVPGYGDIHVASRDICVSPQELRDYAYRVLFPESAEGSPSDRIRFLRSGDTNCTYIAMEEVREIFRKIDWNAISMSDGSISFPDFNAELQFVERRDYGGPLQAPSQAPAASEVSAAPVSRETELPQEGAKRAEAATREEGIPYLDREPSSVDASHIIWGDYSSIVEGTRRTQPPELTQLQREYFGLKSDATFYWRSRGTEGYVAIYFNFISPEGEAQDTRQLAQELAETEGDLSALISFVQRHMANIADVNVESDRGAGANLTSVQLIAALSAMAGLEPASAATEPVPSMHGGKAAVSAGLAQEQAEEYGAQVIAYPGDNVMASFPSITYTMRDGRTGTLDGYFTVTLPSDELEAWRVLVNMQRIARALERGEAINAPLRDLLTNHRDSISFVEMQDSNGTRLTASQIIYRLEQ